jgi:hypothetical protein
VENPKNKCLITPWAKGGKERLNYAMGNIQETSARESKREMYYINVCKIT